MQEEKPIINIAGEKVALGTTHKGMIPFFEKWDNDFAVSIMLGDPLRPVTREVIEANYERHSKEDPRYAVDFAIYEYTTLRRMGDRRYDTVFMDCLSTEFSNPLRRIIELPEIK